MVVLSLPAPSWPRLLAGALARRMDAGLARPPCGSWVWPAPSCSTGSSSWPTPWARPWPWRPSWPRSSPSSAGARRLALAVAPLSRGAVLMRNEAVFLAAGLAVVTGRDRRPPPGRDRLTAA